MILADTSVWINHLSKPHDVMARLLQDDKIVLHSFVIGEVSLGNLKNREIIITSLQTLPVLTIADDSDVMNFIENNSLYGLGVGYIDCHLLAATALANARLWTADKRLAEAAKKLSLSI